MSSVPGRVFIVMLAAAGCIAVARGGAGASQPAVTTLGPIFRSPKFSSGNSFFLLQQRHAEPSILSPIGRAISLDIGVSCFAL